MKKFIFMFTIILGLTSCNSCKDNNTKEAATFGTETKTTAMANVEHLVSLDRQDMYLNYNQTYRWYETQITMNNYLTEENDGSIKEITNIFQVAEEFENGSADVYVVSYTHKPDTTFTIVYNSFWIEDFPLNEDSIKITFKEAFDRLMATNCVKPKSRKCVLRKEVGPKACNPQWIFGNIRQQVYVDAITGEVRETSPAFDFEGGFGKPLGEWP